MTQSVKVFILVTLALTPTLPEIKSVYTFQKIRYIISPVNLANYTWTVKILRFFTWNHLLMNTATYPKKVPSRENSRQAVRAMPMPKNGPKINGTF